MRIDYLGQMKDVRIEKNNTRVAIVSYNEFTEKENIEKLLELMKEEEEDWYSKVSEFEGSFTVSMEDREEFEYFKKWYKKAKKSIKENKEVPEVEAQEEIKTYVAEYENEEFRAVHAHNDSEALEIAHSFENNLGRMIKLFEIFPLSFDVRQVKEEEETAEVEEEKKEASKLQIVKITAKEMRTKYIGSRGGCITGTHYALYEEGKGFCSFDGKGAYILKGNTGKNALQGVIDAGGFIGEMKYTQSI